MHQRQDTIFSIKINPDSIGYCVFAADGAGYPRKLINAGVVVFQDGRDPKTKDPLGVARRAAIAQRALIKQRRQRKRMVDKILENAGFPAGAESIYDVYMLREKALREKLPLRLLRIIFAHLAQRRGYKSNRKDKTPKNEKGNIETAAARLENEISTVRGGTLGAWQARQRAAGSGLVRLRAASQTFIEGKFKYFPTRKMYEEEFKMLFDYQKAFYPEIFTDALKAELHHALFFQRPLKTPEAGLCRYDYEDGVRRAPKAHPLFQKFRILKQANELGIVISEDLKAVPLKEEQRAKLIAMLCAKKKVSFTALKKALGLPKSTRFSHETEWADGLSGNELADFSSQDMFGAAWHEFSIENQWKIIERLREEEDANTLDMWLAEQYPALTADKRENIANAILPVGYGAFGLPALKALVEKMEAAIITEYEAAKRCGLDTSGEFIGDLRRLPPYQIPLQRFLVPGSGKKEDPADKRYGKINNPTVHIALNQLRKIINTQLKLFGRPLAIFVGTDRHLSVPADGRRFFNKKDAAKSAEVLKDIEIPDTAENRLRLSLWSDLARDPNEKHICIYSGQEINRADIFSDKIIILPIVQIDVSFDVSPANKFICTAAGFDAAGGILPSELRPYDENYRQIVERIKLWPAYKLRRAIPINNADERQAVQTLDRQFITKLACLYLQSLYPAISGQSRTRYVRPISCRLIDNFRFNWDLNRFFEGYQEQISKDGEILFSQNPDKRAERTDYRHIAIDAAVIGTMALDDLLHKIGNAYKNIQRGGINYRFATAIKETLPWHSFREEIKKICGGIIVAHKRDKGMVTTAAMRAKGVSATPGALFKGTNYGPAASNILWPKNEPGTAAVRRKITELQPEELLQIPSAGLRRDIEQFVLAKNGNLKSGKDWEKAVSSFRKERGTKKIYIVPKKYALKTEKTPNGIAPDGATHRIPPAALEKQKIDKIRNRGLRDAILDFVEKNRYDQSAKEFSRCVEEFCSQNNIRHIQILENIQPIWIKNDAKKIVQGNMSGGNYCCEVWENSAGLWQGNIISNYAATQNGTAQAEPEFIKNKGWHTAKKIFKLHKLDSVIYEDENGDEQIARIEKISQNGQIALSPHIESKTSARTLNKNDPFQRILKSVAKLGKMRLRPVIINKSGKIYDPYKNHRTTK